MDSDPLSACMLFNICELIIASGSKPIFLYCIYLCKINVLRTDYIISLLNFFVFYLRL